MLQYRLLAADNPLVPPEGSMNAYPIACRLPEYRQDIRDQGSFLLNGSDSKNHQIRTCMEGHFGPHKMLYHYLAHLKVEYNPT